MRIVNRDLIEYIKKNLPCMSCGRYGVDAHHVKPQGSGGDDVPENLMPLCREHHTMGLENVHNMGLNRFIKRFESAKNWLVNSGWEYDEFREKWIKPFNG